MAILRYDFSFPFGQVKRKLKSQEADGHELIHYIPYTTQAVAGTCSFLIK